MSPSNLLVAVCNQEQVQIVDLKSGSYIQKLNGSHGDDVMDVCWSPRNNNQLISAGWVYSFNIIILFPSYSYYFCSN